MRATLRETHANSPADIMAALALFRPGPLKGGLRDAFVRRHNQIEATVHLHPALAPLLQETYGVILYQEQVLKIAHELAGLSLAEADLLRRAMSHFDPGKQMQTLKEKFIAGAEKVNGVAPELAARIWEMMAAFAGYGFPKAHAASYAVVAWRSAWCKAHYPAEFIAAVLANHGGYYPQSVYLNEARRLGLQMRAPHVNHARQQFSVAYPRGEPVLFMGLDQIRDLTRRTQERILRQRPFHDLAEFLQKVDPRREEAENLVQVGAFDGLGAIPDLLRQLVQTPRRPGQLALFAAEAPSGLDWSLDQKVAAQQRLLGTSLEAHPLQLHARQLAEAGVISTVAALSHRGETLRVGGMRQILRRSQTARGDWMAFLSLEDLEGILDVIIFPEVYARARSVLSTSAFPLIVEGKVELDPSSGEPVLTAEKIWRCSPAR
jgi:DNA polymerase III alpha subunit